MFDQSTYYGNEVVNRKVQLQCTIQSVRQMQVRSLYTNSLLTQHAQGSNFILETRLPNDNEIIKLPLKRIEFKRIYNKNMSLEFEAE